MGVVDTEACKFVGIPYLSVNLPHLLSQVASELLACSVEACPSVYARLGGVDS